MASINEIKLDLIKMITNMSDPLRLQRFYQVIEYTEMAPGKQVAKGVLVEELIS